MTCVWAMRVKKFLNGRWKIFNQHLLFSIFLDKIFPVKCKYFSHPWRVKVLKKKAFGYWEITARVSYVCAHVKILSPMYYTKILYISLHVLHIVVHDTRFCFISYTHHITYFVREMKFEEQQSMIHNLLENFKIYGVVLMIL